MIKITRTTIDGSRTVRRFKSLAGARKFARDCVGPQHGEGGHYAVSSDGVCKIEWANITRRELFGYNDRQVVLNTAHEFYRKGCNLFCRQAGYTRDHERQQIGRVVEVADTVTGDHIAGWGVRHNAGETPIIFNEEAVFNTFDGALAHAKRAYLDYLDYLEQAA
jgi:hypothetical protein